MGNYVLVLILKSREFVFKTLKALIPESAQRSVSVVLCGFLLREYKLPKK